MCVPEEKNAIVCQVRINEHVFWQGNVFYNPPGGIRPGGFSFRTLPFPDSEPWRQYPPGNGRDSRPPVWAAGASAAQLCLQIVLGRAAPLHPLLEQRGDRARLHALEILRDELAAH